MNFKEISGNKEQKITRLLRKLHQTVTGLKRHKRLKLSAYMHLDYQSGSNNSIIRSIYQEVLLSKPFSNAET